MFSMIICVANTFGGEIYSLTYKSPPSTVSITRYELWLDILASNLIGYPKKGDKQLV